MEEQLLVPASRSGTCSSSRRMMRPAQLTWANSDPSSGPRRLQEGRKSIQLVMVKRFPLLVMTTMTIRARR
eukprot:8408444-Pyramimonas_sp.AAC.1